MSQRVLERIAQQFPDGVISTHSLHGDDTAVIVRERIADVLAFLKGDPDMAFDLPSDLTAVDYLGREPRFEVVYHLYSTRQKHRVRLKVLVPEESAEVPTSIGVYAGWNWFEREIWDMFGIRFIGHPDPRRMFMQESFVGHPLRKDYPKERRQPLVRREGITR